MYADGYKPRPINDWDDWFHEFVILISHLLYEVEVEHEHHMPGYFFGQSVSHEQIRMGRLANVCAVTIAHLEDMLACVPEDIVAPELKRVLENGEWC